ncbi:hypothetical protein Tsubulata_012100 [Turnera subulata]|uniref:Glutamate receptor n=1 Tax=Turnera subulata TaxID=218843 RepID=A0A9Q0F2G2_9ROSI|nr:hypothetical protein Tsubulata_012100 [Turnera subulata]
MIVMGKHGLLFFIFYLPSLLLLGVLVDESQEATTTTTTNIPVGVVLDLGSPLGEMAERCMSIAVSDFYAANAHHRTRLALLSRNSSTDAVTAASAAIDLIKNEQVLAIIGPQRSSQANFVIELGGKAHVPIVSSSATSPSLSSTRSKYFVRAALDDSSQVKAMTAIIQAYGWREIVLVHEDTEYGNGLVPYLLDGLQEIDTRVPYTSSIPLSFTDSQITRELKNLKEKQKRIFLVHTTAMLGSRLFLLAKDAGMMDAGYAWLVTQELSTQLAPMSEIVMDSMQGVIGVRPFIPLSKELNSFKSRWRKKWNSKKGNSKMIEHELSLFGLWAYDTVWAIAKAVENARTVRSSFIKQNSSRNTINVDLAALGVSETGPRLLSSILKTTFKGLSGNFKLEKGERLSSAFEIFNVVGNLERVLGYWSAQNGLSRNLDKNNSTILDYSVSKSNLKQPIWPGDTTGQPKKLRMGVPLKSGFREFIKVEWDSRNKPIISGFSYDVFLAVIDALPFPFPCEFVPFVNKTKQSAGTYNELLYQIKLQVCLVVWVLEHRTNSEFRGSPNQQLGTIFWFSFSTLVFAHRERLMNNWTRFVVTIWIFVVLILSQSYSASLASMLTVQRLKPAFADLNEIRRHGYPVGIQKDCFMKDFLIKQLKFDETNLKEYVTPEEYRDALINGIHNGGVAAIFDEIPYVKRFISLSCSKFQMVGPTYKADGFGFAFPIGSPFVPHFSRAILKVTEDKDKMEIIERKNFGEATTCEDQGIPSSSSGLGLSSFGGLFIITGVASLFSLLAYILSFLYSHWPVTDTREEQAETSFWLRVIELAKHFDKKDPPGLGLERSGSRIHPVTGPDESTGIFPDTVSDDTQNDPVLVSNNIVGVEEHAGAEAHRIATAEDTTFPLRTYA